MKRLIPVLALFVVCAGAVVWYAMADGPTCNPNGNSYGGVNGPCRDFVPKFCSEYSVASCPTGAYPDWSVAAVYPATICGQIFVTGNKKNCIDTSVEEDCVFRIECKLVDIGNGTMACRGAGGSKTSFVYAVIGDDCTAPVVITPPAP